MNFIWISLIALLSVKCLAQNDPPLWPQHFSQAFYISADSGPGHLNTTAKLFYDFTNQLFRTQYDNGNDTQCQYQFSKRSKCVQIYKNKTVYLFMPEQNICCHYPDQRPPQRDFLQKLNFTYVGQSQLNNQTFLLWQSPQYPQNKYYATRDDKNIPRKYALGSLKRDYFVNSYNDGPISPSVFIIPQYCKKSCNGIRSKSQNNQKQVANKPIFNILTNDYVQA